LPGRARLGPSGNRAALPALDARRCRRREATRTNGALRRRGGPIADLCRRHPDGVDRAAHASKLRSTRSGRLGCGDTGTRHASRRQRYPVPGHQLRRSPAGSRRADRGGARGDTRGASVPRETGGLLLVRRDLPVRVGLVRLAQPDHDVEHDRGGLMPPLLRRQLSKVGVSEDAPPDAAQWRAFLARVRRTYEDAAQDRYMLERSLMTSSREMQDLYEDLRRSEANFKVLIEGMVDAVFVHQNGVICYANPAMAALLGFDGPHELLGKVPASTFIHPEDQYATLDFGRRRDSGEPLRVLRIRWGRRDGEGVFLE